MRLTCGITAAEEKGRLARVVKVLIQHLFNLFAINIHHYSFPMLLTVVLFH
jgi:hypothetical protein